MDSYAQAIGDVGAYTLEKLVLAETLGTQDA
jgi:hypothetical protein